jgi:alkanesulfonate monooxygenase SsuD/methylene tetrahydromethanopterin reductase-like flavin-dependent oxidoreductase (luciferase family)
MAVQTLNHLTGGDRVIVGLGSASPMAAEGLQGRPWGRPALRMRDYVAILRLALSGRPLDHQGAEWSVPYAGPGALGLEPVAVGLDAISDIPILVAGSGPVMTQLAAEIGDGWMPPAFAPGMMDEFVPLLQKGFSRAAAPKTADGFQVWAHVDVLVDDDVRVAMRPFKEYVVTWARMQRPFMIARGYRELADRLEELMRAGEVRDTESRVASGGHLLGDALWEEAIAAVPDEYIDDGWLVGPVDRIRRRVAPWLDSGLSGLVVRYGPQMTHEPVVENLDAFRAIAEAAGRS